MSAHGTRPAGASGTPGILIPVYQPEPGLRTLVGALLDDGHPFVVIVDDGSSPEHAPRFRELAALDRVEVLTHYVNLGKGEALKTGLNHALVHHPEAPGIVTVDADGQHLPADVKRVAEALVESPDHLCLGVREFGGDVPWKSRVGNLASRWMLRLVAGGDLRDTQTGLRGIPRSFMASLLPLRTARYEFELEMLIRALEGHVPIRQVPIATVYHDDNAGSHFNPLWDSLRVYFVFFRFLISSLLTAGLDLLTFSASFALSGSLFTSQALGRLVAGSFNFLVNKHVVFRARESYAVEAARYASLVVLLMMVSYFLIDALVARFGTPVVPTKIAVEGFLFLVSFAAQRILVFASGPEDAFDGAVEPTDWDAYYERPGRFTPLTRRITTRKLIRFLRLYGGDLRHARILELGGADSCFFDAVTAALKPARYEVVDSNTKGLARFRERHRGDPRVGLHRADVRALPLRGEADVCFSVGLIEHFDPEGTARAVRAHLDAVRPGGLVVLFFPTPTVPYRVTRRLAEWLGIWAFPDERPLGFEEVEDALGGRGRVLRREINWWIVLTQGLLAVEVDGAAPASPLPPDASGPPPDAGA